MQAATLERGMTRIRYFLRAGAARARAAADGRSVVLTRPGGETLSASAACLEALARRGDIVRSGSIVALAADGCVRPAVNLAESPLALLMSRRTRGGAAFLSEVEFDAGERLRADYTRGQIMPRLGVNWDAAVASGRREGGAGGTADLTDAALGARRRVDRAIAAVGPELAGVLIDICCFLKGLERVEIERGWPARSAKVVLKTALGALARHYFPDRMRAQGGRAPILHWGAEGFRPEMRS